MQGRSGSFELGCDFRPLRSGLGGNKKGRGVNTRPFALIILISLLTRYDLPESARPSGRSPRVKQVKRVSRELVRALTYIAWHDPHTIAD